MPPPALKSLADKAGKSMKDAERYYADAKAQVKPKTDADYKKVMGIVKKRLGLKTKPVESIAESMIDYKLTDGQEDYDVRVFRDLDGQISFATLDDVHIDPDTDPRIAIVGKLANEYNWPHDHAFPEEIEGYEGSIKELAQKVLTVAYPGM